MALQQDPFADAWAMVEAEKELQQERLSQVDWGSAKKALQWQWLLNEYLLHSFSQEVQQEDAQQEVPDSSQDDAEAQFLGQVLGDMAWK